MEGLAAIAVVTVLVWAAVVFFRGGPLAACLIFMLAATCFSADFLVIGTGSVKLTLDRILWCVLIFLYLVWRQRGWAAPKPLGSVELVLLAFVAFLALRTFTADWQALGYSPVAHLVLWYLMPLGVYWVARQSRLAERESRMILACLALFGLYLAVTVVAEKFEMYALVFPRYIVDSMADKNAEFVGRGRGPLLHPIVTGIQLAACWSAALLAWPRCGRSGRAALVLFSLLAALAVHSTLTRSVWMGAALSLAVLVMAGLPKQWRVPVLAFAAVAAVAVTLACWDQLVAFKRDRNLSARETADSVDLRPVMAIVAWKMVEDRPWFGCGFDQYMPEHLAYLHDRSTELVLERARPYVPHNLLLGIVTETGLVGLGLFVGLLALWTRDAWRLWQTAAAPLWARQLGLLFLATLAAYLVNGMFHHIAMVPMANILLFFLAGAMEGVGRDWGLGIRDWKDASGEFVPSPSPSGRGSG
jgi:O-antigen ligase